MKNAKLYLIHADGKLNDCHACLDPINCRSICLVIGNNCCNYRTVVLCLVS